MIHILSKIKNGTIYKKGDDFKALLYFYSKYIDPSKTSIHTETISPVTSIPINQNL